MEYQGQKVKWLKVAEYYAFARWIATPSIMKNPRTQGDFCVLYDLDASTLTRWKNDTNFWEDVKRYEDEWALGYGADIIASIIGNAIKGDTKAQELFMTHYKGYTKKLQSERSESKTLEIGPNLTSTLMKRHRERKELEEKNKNGNGTDSN